MCPGFPRSSDASASCLLQAGCRYFGTNDSRRTPYGFLDTCRLARLELWLLWSNANCKVNCPRYISPFVLQNDKNTPEIIDKPIGGYEFLPLPFSCELVHSTCDISFCRHVYLRSQAPTRGLLTLSLIGNLKTPNHE